MKVFISWSGERSLYVAQYLNEWLPSVIQKVEPWLSVEISKGARWTAEIAKALDETKFGFFCVTPENQSEPWLNFEAGALSKSVGERSFVCAYLIEMKSTDILGPLKDFQLTNTDHDDTLRLIKTMNMALGTEALPEKRLEESFRMWWPHLEEKLNNLPAIENLVPATRPPEEIQEETLEIVRRIEKELTNQRSGVTPSTWGSLASSVLPIYLSEALKSKRLSDVLTLQEAFALSDATAEKVTEKSVMREMWEKGREKEKK